MLIKIGDFAREAGITVKALRHYEKLGLLKPAWINRFNGYRYYAPDQFARLDLLLAYKRAGFSLSQIERLLDAGLSESEFRMILEDRNHSLEKQISDDRNKLATINDCLICLRQGGSRSDVEQSLSDRKHSKIDELLEEKMKIPIKNMPAMKLVGLCYRGRNEHNEISDTWTTFNQRTNEITNSTGEAAYGVCSIPEGLPEGEFEYRCMLPVSDFQNIPAGMTRLELEPMQAAVFEHRGSYETLARTYTSIYQKWLPEAGWQPLKKGLDIEVYTDAFKDFAPDSLMYIYVPIQA